MMAGGDGCPMAVTRVIDILDVRSRVVHFDAAQHELIELVSAQ